MNLSNIRLLAVGMDSSAVGTTSLHPLALAMLLIAGIATLILPRKHMPLPLLAVAAFLPEGQRLVLGGLDFPMVRLMLLFGWMRILTRREYLALIRKPLDIIVIAWCAVSTVMYVILMGPSGAPFKLGASYDALGLYFLFRVYITSWNDVRRITCWFVLLGIPSSLLFLFEYKTGRNLFAMFGSVPEQVSQRQGHMRCQGPYPHPIIAGCFWALLMPLVASLWWQRGNWRWVCAIGLGVIVLLVALSGSSTPLSSLVFGCIGFCCFPLRRHMRFIRWCVLLSLITLHIVMKGPVWSLLGKLDLAGGSTGYHRVLTIDETVKHFDEWWLKGIPSVTHWNPLLYDITNHYVLEGLRGGLITMCLHIAILVFAFKAAGRVWRKGASNRANCMIGWALSTTVFVHSITFLGVAYFGPILLLWYLHLAMVAGLDPGGNLSRRIPVQVAGRQSSPVRAKMVAPVCTSN